MLTADMWVPTFLRRRPSYVTFVPFLCTVLLWNLAFGGLKFLIKNLTVGHLSIGPGQLLEHVVAYLSIGCVVAYLVGGCLCHAVRKRLLVFLTAVTAIAALLAEYKWGLASETSLTVTGIVIGFSFGIFSVARTVISCYEIKRTGLHSTTVNGLVVVMVIAPTIVGAFVSTRLFELVGVQTLWVFLGFFAMIGLISHWLRYGDVEELLPFRESVRRVGSDFLFVLRNRSVIVFPSAALWAISIIVGVKSIPYAAETYGIRESMGSFVLLATAVGAVAGNAATLWTAARRRWTWFRLATYVFAVLIVLFPLLTRSFSDMVVYSLVLGFAMGMATNLADSAYLRYIGDHDVKENGAALSGLALNIFIAMLLVALHWLPVWVHFPVLGIFATVMGFYVLLRLKTLDGDIKE